MLVKIIKISKLEVQSVNDVISLFESIKLFAVSFAGELRWTWR